MALYATLLAVAAILFMVPDLAAAGAAAGLIFLVSFALAHWTALLARRRAEASPGSFKTPFFPLVPVVGVVSCGGLAVFQAVTVPAAGAISGVWLGLGVILYFSLFASRAEVVDAFAEANDPKLVRLRGRTPVVLVPVANPESAVGLVEVADAIAPAEFGRVLLLTVMRKPDRPSAETPEKVRAAQQVLSEAVTAALWSGHSPEALMTIASDPWQEIQRITRTRACESVLLGLTKLDESKTLDQLENFLNSVDCDVAVLNAPVGWRLSDVRRVVVPVGGRGRQHELRARLLGSLARSASRELDFVQVVAESTSPSELDEAKKRLTRRAEEEFRQGARVEILLSDDPVKAVLDHAEAADLMVLGLPRVGGRTLFGEVAVRIARQARGATIMLSQAR
jgi:hypothetical protein